MAKALRPPPYLPTAWRRSAVTQTGMLDQRLDANAGRGLAAAPSNFRAQPGGQRQPAINIVDQPRACLAGAELSAASQRMRTGNARLLAAQ